MNCHEMSQSAAMQIVFQCATVMLLMANIGGHIKDDIFENQLFVSTDHHHYHYHFTLKKLLRFSSQF